LFTLYVRVIRGFPPDLLRVWTDETSFETAVDLGASNSTSESSSKESEETEGAGDNEEDESRVSSSGGVDSRRRTGAFRLGFGMITERCVPGGLPSLRGRPIGRPVGFKGIGFALTLVMVVLDLIVVFDFVLDFFPFSSLVLRGGASVRLPRVPRQFLEPHLQGC
jgi:hypothetical protein